MTPTTLLGNGSPAFSKHYTRKAHMAPVKTHDDALEAIHDAICETAYYRDFGYS